MGYQLSVHLTEGPNIEGLPDNREIIWVGYNVNSTPLKWWIVEREKNATRDLGIIHILNGGVRVPIVRSLKGDDPERYELACLVEGKDAVLYIPRDNIKIEKCIAGYFKQKGLIAVGVSDTEYNEAYAPKWMVEREERILLSPIYEYEKIFGNP